MRKVALAATLLSLALGAAPPLRPLLIQSRVPQRVPQPEPPRVRRQQVRWAQPWEP